MAKREWVVGFLIDEGGDEVVLILKNRPKWQAGKLNGVGGKVEPSDVDAHAAMVREFREETGLLVFSWHHFASLTWEEGVVRFYRAFAPLETLTACRTVTDEDIVRIHIRSLLDPVWRPVVTPNLLWLVPLAAHRHDDYGVINVVETGTTMRKLGRLGVDAS